MIKYSIFLAAVFGTSVAAFSAIAPANTPPAKANNVTILYKSDAWPVVGPLVVETCGVEDCSDTPQS